MPRPPHVADSSRGLSDTVFGALVAQMRARGRPVHPLHVGDTYLLPFEGARAEWQRIAAQPDLHTYAATQGEPVLLAAIEDWLREHTGHAVDRERLQVMSGSTVGLSLGIDMLVSPGDEVLLPAPFWPLIRGIIRSRGATPIEVPMFDRLGAIDIERELEARVTERTVALYINTPHNPTSVVLDAHELEAFVRVAKKHDLWIISDDAYDPLRYGVESPTPLWAREDTSARTLAFYTCSKMFAMAGWRIGFSIAPPHVAPVLRGMQTFRNHCAPKPLERAVVPAFRDGADWLRVTRDTYARAGASAANALGLPEPRGGTFLFFDARPYAGGESSLPFLERCLEAGVLLTPGSACGREYEGFARLCFTAVPPAELEDAVTRVAGVMGRRGSAA